MTKVVPLVLDGPRHVDGSQNYTICVGGAPISQNEATFSQPHGVILAILAKNGYFLRASTSEVRPVPPMVMFVKRWNEFT